MKKLLFLIVLIVLALPFYAATAPTAQPVYGGYIQDFDSIETGTNISRVFISTLSANSMFYADVDHTVPTSPTFGTFQTVPDFDADDGFGTGVRCFSADKNSGYIYVGTSNGLYGADVTASSRYVVDTTIPEDIEVIDSYIFWIVTSGTNVYLYYGEIYPTGSGSNTGKVYATGSATITTGGYSGSYAPEIMINPSNNHLYVFEDGTPPTFYESSDTYDTINNSTTFSTLPITDLNATGRNYFASGIASDGRIFAAGYENSGTADPYMAYTDDAGINWTAFDLPSTVDTGWGSRVSFADTTPDYHVFYGRGVSDNQGKSGTWTMMASNVTPVMDGPHNADPVNENIVYLRTDWGLGYYDCNVSQADEWNTGITAVQVNDFAMDTSKDKAWVASKSGVWYVDNYSTSPSWISTPLWPVDDSTPYNAIATTTTADTVYAGSQYAVWKYCSAYGAMNSSNFSKVLDIPALDPTAIGLYASCVVIDTFSTNEQIYVGIYDFEDHDEITIDRGGVYQVTYNGSSWSYNLVLDDVDPYDIVVVQEAGNTVLYVGVQYDNSATLRRSVYRCEWNGSSWTNTFDLIDTVGTYVNATIYDLYVTKTDTIFAVGTDEFDTNVRCYSKAIGSGASWTVVHNNTGFPTAGVGKAVTYDEVNHDIYAAVDNIIYVKTHGISSWTNYFTYPVGTEIEFIYYDDLLVGTDYGLYGHDASQDEPLPVTLSSFTGSFANNECSISWATASEYNNQGWNIYKSENENFDTAYMITSNLISGYGTTNEFHSYSYEDKGEFKSGTTYWYWLESIDFSGQSLCYNPISIKINNDDENHTPPVTDVFELRQNYPNPFNPNTTISFNLPEASNVTLSIYNLKGELVDKIVDKNLGKGFYNISYNADNLSSAMYLYKLRAGNKTVVRKMILMK